MNQSKWRNMPKIFFVLLLQYFYFPDLGYAFPSNKTSFGGLTYDDYGLDGRELATLAQKWNVTEMEVIFNALEFQLNYIVSDFILDSMIQAVAYTRECKDEGAEVPYSHLAYDLVLDDTPPGVGDNERNIAIDVKVQDRVDSMVYKDIYDPVTGAKSAEVMFCMRFSLLTDTATPIEANYLETVVGFTANLTAGFEVDTVFVEPKDKVVATAVKAYEVDAYLCDESNQPVTGEALTTARTQGEVVRVCVTPTQDARDDDIFMREIKEFTWFRDYGGALGMVSQVAVQDSKEAPNFLTLLYCVRGNIICAFESILFASMFLVPGEVFGTGTALMQFGNSSGTRQLGDSESSSLSRLLQGGDEDIPPSEFDLAYELRMGEKFTGMLKTSSSSKLSSIYSMIVTGVTMSLTLMMIT
mmetsp:Transcript_15274/g.42394  ORF Transcript_15274/g.42394 Transcript_15274/m.42394 type:complete len:413 (+) Transcript_15274:242-1480(+)